MKKKTICGSFLFSVCSVVGVWSYARRRRVHSTPITARLCPSTVDGWHYRRPLALALTSPVNRQPALLPSLVASLSSTLSRFLDAPLSHRVSSRSVTVFASSSATADPQTPVDFSSSTNNCRTFALTTNNINVPASARAVLCFFPFVRREKRLPNDRPTLRVIFAPTAIEFQCDIALSFSQVFIVFIFLLLLGFVFVKLRARSVSPQSSRCQYQPAVSVRSLGFTSPLVHNMMWLL